MLLPTGKKKKSFDFCFQEVFAVKSIAITTIDELRRLVTTRQPHLILLEQADGTIQQHVIHFEGRFVMLEGVDLLSHFDLLYKLMYIFNFQFPPHLHNFYNFFDSFFFKYCKANKIVQEFSNLIELQKDE